MKQFLLLLVGLILASGVATATTSFVTCTNPAAVGANGSDTLPQSTLACPQFAVPLGDTLISVTLNLEDSFNQGDPGNPTNTFDFFYTLVNADVALANGASPNTCIASGAGSATTCEDIITGQISGGVYYQLGNVITNPAALVNYIGAGTVTVANVSAAPDPAGGNLLATGQLSTTAFITFNYVPTSSIPEPATFGMMGATLVGLGFIARKRKS